MNVVDNAERENYLKYSEARMRQLKMDLLRLTDAERGEFFQVITEHAPLFSKLFPGHKLLDVAAGKDSGAQNEILAAYRAWAASRRG